MAEANGFGQALWRSIRPNILAQYRDTAILLNLLVIIALVHFGFFFLSLIGVDAELILWLRSMHKWATLSVFATFLYSLVVRGIAVARRKRI